MKKTVLKLAITALPFMPFVSDGQVKPRLAGLENNTEYISFLEEEERLRKKEDSLTNAVANIRNMFRTAPENRERYTKDILRLEGEIFEIRNSIGVVANKINSIEQEFIINNLIATPEGEQARGSQGRSNIPPENSKVLVLNDYFRLHLPTNDLEHLLEAQENETTTAAFIEQYKENYKAMADIAEVYKTVDNAFEADTLFNKYSVVGNLNDAVADSIAVLWGSVFDNKTFAYNLIFERMGRSDLLAFFDRKQRETREDIATAKEQAMSPAVLAYIKQKKLIFDYEKTIAETLKYKTSQDSLSRAEAAFDKSGYSFPKLTMAERLFLEYEDVSIHSPAKYNARNPIPELTIYSKGVIYRILLGAFQRIQPVSVMRGAYPVGYLKGTDGRYSYYAGGYPTLNEAKEGLDALKKAGFRSPKIAVWDYSDYRVLDESDLKKGTGTIYSVEITGISSLPKSVRDIVSEEFSGTEISRSGDSFIIGPFTDKMEAEELLDMIRREGNGFKVKITESGT